MNFKDFMVKDHRDCDSVFSEVEGFVDRGEWDIAKEAFGRFKKDMDIHFGIEEEIIFPEFNKNAGGGCNPTMVMIMEHDQMRKLLSLLEENLASKNRDSFFGNSDTLMMVLQQHNMKEEQIMYNLCLDSLSGVQDEILKKVTEYKNGK